MTSHWVYYFYMRSLQLSTYVIMWMFKCFVILSLFMYNVHVSFRNRTQFFDSYVIIAIHWGQIKWLVVSLSTSWILRCNRKRMRLPSISSGLGILHITCPLQSSPDWFDFSIWQQIFERSLSPKYGMVWKMVVDASSKFWSDVLQSKSVLQPENFVRYTYVLCDNSIKITVVYSICGLENSFLSALYMSVYLLVDSANVAQDFLGDTGIMC